ncbi:MULTISPECIES: hypothetical protein [unclassified Aliivibrio]|uniref:hypothetical protein n=1 Tax=unclassified Aliivibrio TaxID=2645654 RepID=UPI0011461416|nr:MULTISPECIES: hypothetical protein [unclassified Aliivibrio]
MENYMMYWWAGDLANHYMPWGLTMPQFNKIIKLSQYVFGLLSLFELVQFSKVMQQLNYASRVYYMTNKLPYVVATFPMLLVPKLISGSMSLVRNEITSKQLFSSVLLPAVKLELSQIKIDSHSTKAARIFKWLSDNPLSDNTRKVLIFVSFAIFSLIDIFTS